jgi:hypothetical protein
MPYENNEYTKYNPLHEELGITLTTNVKYEKKITYNKYEIIDKNGNKKECFKKFITLVDYVKFLIGKYKNDNIQTLPCQDNSKIEMKKDLITMQSNTDEKTLFQKYINSYHNYAYVDGFFYYLTSILLDSGFIHGIEFYDSYICISKECEIDIVDDFEYLCDSNFFNEKLNTQFHFKDENLGEFFNKKQPIVISDEVKMVEFEELEELENEKDKIVKNDATNIDESNIDDPIVEDESYIEIANEIDDEIDDGDSDIEYTDDEDELDTRDCDYETENSEDSNIEELDIDDSEDIENKKEIETLKLVIKKIPTQVIAIEKCEGTFDSLLEKNLLTIEELESAMFQIIIILYVYQNVFDFTHNDLHTNNVMFIETNQEFLYYTIQKTHYKIPTFGKIYKIIDFGRAIYKINNKLICSDSFSQNGTAHTQYNFEPFYNKNKKIVLPNKSFDLCRLSCSMIDFIIDDVKQIEQFREVPIYDLIISWLYDDNGKNVLYKNNGEERYPDFKLYKMIARIVHNHIPDKQIHHHCFNKYKIALPILPTLYTNINIDEIVKIQVHL